MYLSGFWLTLTGGKPFGDSCLGSVPADARRVRPLDNIYKSHSFVKSSLYNKHKKPKYDKCYQQLEADGRDLVPD